MKKLLIVAMLASLSALFAMDACCRRSCKRCPEKEECREEGCTERKTTECRVDNGEC